MEPNRDIDVPNISDRVECFEQDLEPPYAMLRCSYPKGHSGPHLWEKLRKKKTHARH